MKIIKKVTTTGVVAVMVMCNSMAFAVENVTGVVNTETLRLRKDASTESSVLELLSKDDKVDILEEKDGWYKVKFKDYTGYVSKEFITTSENVKNNTNDEDKKSNESENSQTNNEQASQSAIQGTITISKKDAKLITDSKLYILPLINSNIVTSITKDTKVTIVNTTGGWAYVSTDEFSGWVRLDKLSVLDANNSNNEKSEDTSTSEENNQKVNTEEENSQEEIKKENETKQDDFESRTAYIKEASVNVRKSSNTSSEVINTLSQNTQIKLIGEENGWYKVEVNGTNGYILKTLVSDKKVEVTSRSAVATRNVQQAKAIETANNVVNTPSTTSAKQTVQNNTVVTSAQTTSEAENVSSTSETVQSTTSKGEEVIAYAKQFLGCRYVYGGSGPSVFDCSGFTMFVYSHFGFNIGHSAVTQAYVGTYVPRSALQPGDLIIINNESNTSIGHVGMYVGGGNFIHASSGSGKIIISPLSNAYYNARYVTARRIFN